MLPTFSSHTTSVSARPPSICAVNQHLRREALPTFYSSNIFTAQLDNDQDLETAQRWLSAIRDGNVAHLRRLAMCGWTRVPFGHMVSCRWVTVALDLKAGTMELDQVDGKFAADGGAKGLKGTMQELEVAYREVVTAKGGRKFDGEMVGELMTGFNLLCTGY